MKCIDSGAHVAGVLPLADVPIEKDVEFGP
jgi:hypothetical protein